MFFEIFSPYKQFLAALFRKQKAVFFAGTTAHIYSTILRLQKIPIFFQIAKTACAESLKLS